jgi:hypothetical protein
MSPPPATGAYRTGQAKLKNRILEDEGGDVVKCSPAARANRAPTAPEQTAMQICPIAREPLHGPMADACLDDLSARDAQGPAEYVMRPTALDPARQSTRAPTGVVAPSAHCGGVRRWREGGKSPADPARLVVAGRATNPAGATAIPPPSE